MLKRFLAALLLLVLSALPARAGQTGGDPIAITIAGEYAD